ncbi:MAG: sugar-binding transcriptional regulator, partial [Microbacterium sp.]|nr:sugar-binding transcriptional regulator [Microbacterium sp.]
LVVFSVGAADAGVPSHVYSGGYLDAADLAALRRDGVAGDVATVFYRADGSSTGIVMNERSTGPTFATLRRTPRRLCVVAGEAKVAALRGAIAAGLVTDLVVDEPTAHALLRAA